MKERRGGWLLAHTLITEVREGTSPLLRTKGEGSPLPLTLFLGLSLEKGGSPHLVGINQGRTVSDKEGALL